MKLILAFALLLFTSIGFCQNADLPNDFLGKDFHKGRRDKLRETIPANSVARVYCQPIGVAFPATRENSCWHTALLRHARRLRRLLAQTKGAR